MFEIEHAYRGYSPRRAARSVAIRARALSTTTTFVALLVGAIVFAVAYADGGYSLAARSTLAVALWWAILLGVALGVWPLERVPRGAIAVGAMLALFALWALASAAWAPSVEAAVHEFDRNALYLGVYVLAVVAVSRGRLPAWIAGLTFALTATALVALASRLFPGLFSDRGLVTALPSSAARLSFPLGYWNGLGLFTAMAYPLLLHAALAGGRARRRLSLGVVPALGATIYLTSSRGAVVALGCGLVVFVAAEARRAEAVGALLIASAGTAAAIVALVPRNALVDGPVNSAAAHSEGWWAALLIALVCIATAALSGLERRLAVRLARSGRLGRRVAAAAIVGLVGVIVVAIAVSNAWRDFTRVPTTTAVANGDAHLLSGGGSGRWQFWQAAVDEFTSSPVHGHGAGSYEAWWAQHASFSYFVRDAHSLYLETLGELGIVGLALLVGALATGVVVSVRRLRTPDAPRPAIAALLATFTIFLVGAGVDWMWELTAVTVVGVCILGLLSGPATLPPLFREPAGPAARHRPVRALAAACACALVVAEGLTLLADVQVRRSDTAARAGQNSAARSHAVAATLIEPWAATPRLQLALVDEGAGNIAAARRAIGKAIERDRTDWRLWLVAARIESRLGQPDAAARSRARAAMLNPRSPFVVNVGTRDD